MPVTVNSVWRGAEGIKLQPTYPRFARTARGATLTLVFRGPYIDLRTYGPDIGDDIVLGAFDYAPAGEIVYADSVECQPDGAGEDGTGTLTVVYSNLPDSGGVLLHTGGSTVMEEVDWTVVEKRLETHPRYNNGAFAPYGFASGTTSFTKNSGGNISISEFWKSFKDATEAERADLRGEIPPGAVALFNMIDDIAKKYFAGQESYVTSAPVARKTTRGPAAAVASACGARTTSAPFTTAPSGYQWLKTAHRSIRQGPSSTWEEVEEHTGAKLWDPDIYGSLI